jgi:hypothetical protein
MPKIARPPVGSVRDELRRFLRDLPLVLAIGAVATLGVRGWQLAEGEPLVDSALLALAAFCTFLLLSPLMWLRHRRGFGVRGRDLGRWTVVFAVVLGWCVLWLAAIIGALALAGALGSR